MGVYSKIVSVPKQIDTIHTFIGGTRTDITSGWTFVNGVRKQVFPSTEYYTEVYSKTTGGSYSESLTWGRYKVVISGGGGSGAAYIRESGNAQLKYIYDGYKGEEKTIYIDVLADETKTFSGTVGTGGSGGTVSISSTITASSSYGAVGTGYENGSHANTKYEYTRNEDPRSAAWVGGSGGGSTSLVIDGVLNNTAKGGNGGTITINYSGYKTSTGGAGGSGGTTSGTGASGGASGGSSIGHPPHGNKSYTGAAGSAGYVRIYKSNIYPE